MISLILGVALAADPGDQVVSLSITWQSWEPGQPWQKTTPSNRFAQGTVVAGAGSDKWLLTSAQVVENATLVRVRKHGEPGESIARVTAVDREANLALLAVDEPGFFADLTPVKLAKKPVTSGAVSIVRWKENQLEATEGRVARAATLESPTGVLGFVGLRVTTDLSAGGWAEAVFVGSELVGLTTGQSRSEATVVPAGFIAPWLDGMRKTGKTHDWAGDLGIAAQSMRSPELASWLGTGAPEGILILDVPRGSSACGVMKRRDVLISVEGHPLDADGNVRHPLYGLISWEYLLTHHLPGDDLKVQVIRDKKPMDLTLKLRSFTAASWLVPANRITPPPYLMAGGLVFREFDESYQARAPELRIVSEAKRRSQTPDRRRVVVLASVLADPFTLGYHTFGDLMVEAVNGQPVDSVNDVLEALKTPVNGFHVVTFHPNPRAAELVLDAADFDAATKRIAASYGVQSLYRAGTPPPDLGPPCDADGK